MNNFYEIKGNLLDCDAQYIAHQCNCLTTQGSGLAGSIFKKFYYANDYAKRIGKKLPLKDEYPGMFKIHGNGFNKRFVINIFSQIYPGRAHLFGKDNASNRLHFLSSALDKIAKIDDIRSIAFPKYFGCGLAGGNWEDYYDIFYKWAENNPHINVYIIELQE